MSQRVRVSSTGGTGLSAATFQVTHPSTSGVFPALGNLLTSTLDVGDAGIPAVTDVDGDGRLDLLVGNYDGNVLRYEQTAANAATFTSLGNLTTDGTTRLDARVLAAPAVTDLDGDGRLDLLLGNVDGTVQRYEQTAANGAAFALVGTLTTDGTTALDVGSYAVPTVTDVDGDGLLDLLVGGYAGLVPRYEQLPVPTVTALSVAAELPGQAVTLTGTGFVAGSTVSFGGVAAASVSYTSPTSLTAVVPVGATPGSSAITVGNYDVASPAAGSPAFEVLQVYRSTAASGCLTTAALTLSGTGGAGSWRYLRLPGAGGAVVAAVEDTRNLGTVTAGFQALGTGTTTPVRRDGRANRRYLDRNFYLTATNQTFTGQTVRVRFFGLVSELSRLTAADPAATAATLNVSQYDGANEDCQLANNSPTGQRRLLPAPATVLSGANWFTAEVSVTDHFSEFYLTGASSPLPVELTTFAVTPEGPAAVRLAWNTASEQNSARFEVERSADGKDFGKLGEVAAQGSTTRPTAYTFRDAAAPTGTVYYRLRQVDLDGTASYSPVRAVTLGGPVAFTAYPNPAHGAVTVAGLPAHAPVTVLDALGRPLATATADAGGSARLALPAGLAAGVYIVRSGQQARRLTLE